MDLFQFALAGQAFPIDGLGNYINYNKQGRGEEG
jgi:hypothetical protein